MKRWAPVVVALLLVASIAAGSAIKSWTAGDVVTVTDLNGNFSHIHGLMVGGHGPRLVNNDIVSNAAITHSKMATPGLLPKSSFVIGNPNTQAACTSGTCAQSAASGAAATCVWNATGSYTCTWSVARANALYNVQLTSMYCTSGTGPCFCSVNGSTGASAFGIICLDAGNANANAVVGVLVMDDDT